MAKPKPVKWLNEVDKLCKKHNLPPLSWVVVDVPGRKNATEEQIRQVYEAAKAGKYDLIGIDTKGLLQ